MKKLITIIAVFIAASQLATAQQREQYSQYVMNNYLLNPAIGGAYSFWNLKLGYRQQWAGFEDPTGRGVGPRTFFATLHGPIHHPTEIKYVKKRRPHHGVGMYAYSDKTGPVTYNGLFGSYSYHHKLNKKTTASIGAWLGVKEFRINGDEINFVKDPIDNLISNDFQSVFVPDMDLGFWLHNEKMFTGLTITQMLNSNISIESTDVVENAAELKFHYFYTFGWIFQLNEDWYLSPSTMIKYIRPAPVQVDLNLRFIYSNIIWVGASYRNLDALSFIAQYVWNNKLEIGYAYDLTFSELRNYNSGSHEIIVGVRWGGKHKRKFCPSQFW